MGSGVYNEKHHHRNGNLCASAASTNKIFLPILCRLSIKDTSTTATQPTSRSRSRSRRRRSLCGDPRSPTVSCMGQVKLHPSSPNHKIINKSCAQQRRRRRQLGSKLSGDENSECGAVVNFAELDPPLPVMKKLPVPSVSVSLWKRRSSLPQLTDIQIPTFQTSLEPPPSI